MTKRKTTITAGKLVKTVVYTVPHPRDSEHVRASRITSAALKALRTVCGSL